MAKREPYVLREFRGLNQGLQPQKIADNQFQELENFFLKNKELRMRTGTTRLSNNAASEQLYSLQSYDTDTAAWTIIFGGSTRIFVYDVATKSINAVSGSTYTASVLPWSMKQYNDTMYLARQGSGSVQRTDGSTVTAAGIAAPTAAPTVAQNATGVMDAGDYRVVYTFARLNTDGDVLAESDFSPVSSAVTLGANDSINVSALQVSSTSGVNARRLYVTLVNQTGQYFLATTINDNIATTGSVNKVQADLGDAASTQNGVPPPNTRHLEVFNERLWVTDGTDLFFSEDGQPESFGTFSVISVNKQDGFAITGIKAFNERLIVGKTRGMYYITGEDESTLQRRQLSPRHGCVSHHSMQVTKDSCFWFGGDNFYVTDGNTVQPIGNTEVRDFIDGIATADYGTVTSAIDSVNEWYIVSAVSSGTRKLAVYNYTDHEWTTFTYAGAVGAPRAFGDFSDSGGQPVLYCIPSATTPGTHLYEFNSGVTDDGTNITYVFRTKNFDFNQPDILKVMTHAQILIEDVDVSETLSFSIFRDDQTAAINTTSIATLGGYQWKLFPLSNLADPGHYLSVRMTYTGDTQFVISELGFLVVPLSRRAPAA